MWSESWEFVGEGSAPSHSISLDSSVLVRVQFCFGRWVKIYDNLITKLLESAHYWCSGRL